MTLPINNFLNDQDDDLENPGNSINNAGNADDERIEPEEGARPGEEEYMEDVDSPATVEDLAETEIYAPNEEEEIDLAEMEETGLSEQDETGYEKNNDELGVDEDDEIINPDEDKRSGSGINVDVHFAERSQGRTTGRMIDHEPGTPGI